MGGYFPGIPGFVAFAGIKFGGYYLAGLTLKKLEPVIAASALKIAAMRTGFGIVIGPVLTIAMVAVASSLFPHANPAPNSTAEAIANIGVYAFVFVLRVLIWTLVIHLSTESFDLPRSTFWKYAAFGAVWSCLLDVLAIGLALIAPGQIAIC